MVNADIAARRRSAGSCLPVPSAAHTDVERPVLPEHVVVRSGTEYVRQLPFVALRRGTVTCRAGDRGRQVR